jgi:hypothetical protein
MRTLEGAAAFAHFLKLLAGHKNPFRHGPSHMKTGNGMHHAEAPLEPPRSANCIEAGASKIANLPSKIRDELNYRIADGEQGAELVAWLNSKPEVVRVITERFDGTPIFEQNLSEWRQRGYQKWLAHRNMFDESNALGDNAEVLAETGIDCDKLLLTLTAAYAEAIQNWIVTPAEQMTYKLAVYKNLTNGVIALRRAEIQNVRLEIERERLELLREKRGNKSSPRSGSEPHSRPATAEGAPPAASLSPSTPPCIPHTEHLSSDSSPAGSAAFDDSSSRPPDGDIRTPSEPYRIGAVSTGSRPRACREAGGGPGQGEPSAPTAAKESASVIPEPDETPGPDPGILAPPPAISYEFWRELRSPSFAGVPRGGPFRQKPDDTSSALPSAALPATRPAPAPQPKPSAPPAVHPGATRLAPILTQPFVPNQVRPRNPNKTIIACRPVPPLVKHNTTIGAAR